MRHCAWMIFLEIYVVQEHVGMLSVTTGITQSELFKGLSTAEKDDILRFMPVHHYRAGEYVFMTGEDAECLFLLHEGLVKVSYITFNGEERILDVFQSGEIFGDLFIGSYRFRIGMAEAASDVYVSRLSECHFNALIERYPILALNYIRYQADRQREMMARMHALMRMDASCRLLGTLLSLARRHTSKMAGCYQLSDSLTQEDLAKMAGLNRSTVSSMINRFRREGLLGGTGRALTIYPNAVEQRLIDAGVEILE